MNEIYGISLDLEGTLVNLEPLHHLTHLETVQHFGGKTESIEDLMPHIPHFIGGPNERIIEEIKSFTNTTASLQEIKKFHKSSYDEKFLIASMEPRPGVINAIKELIDTDYSIAIGSLTSHKYADTILSKSGIRSLIPENFIVLKEDVKNLKPAPDVWIECAHRMKVRPEETLVFEDSPCGILGARACKAKTIGMPVYRIPKVINDLYEAGASRVFLDWREINLFMLLENLEQE